MGSHRRNGGEGAIVEEAVSAMGDAFQQMAQGLARMQEALSLQAQEADHRLQEALRLQEQRTATVLSEAVRQMEQKLQEKDNAIRTLQERLDAHLQEVQGKAKAVEVRAMILDKSVGERASQYLEDRLQKVEASLQRAIQTFFPRVEALLRQLEDHSPPGAPSAVTSAVNAPNTTATIEAAAGTRIEDFSPGAPRPTSSISTSSSRGATATGGAGAGALEEEREIERVQLRAREAVERRDRSRASPCPLGEDLCKAAREERLNDIRRLLDSGADVNYTNCDGFTPLLRACLHVPNMEIVSLLLERSADTNALDTGGNSALHLASWLDSSGQCTALLIAAGAAVDSRNVYGATPLHCAAFESNEAVARALVVAGARRDLKIWGGDYKGKTPFDVATSAAVRNLLRELK